MVRDRFNAVSLTEAMRLVRGKQKLPPRTVAITFDDCYRDNLFAARLLAEHKLPACFFIPSQYVGTDHVMPWDRALPRMANLTWDEVREMASLGHEIGSHTISHPNLAELSLDETRFELTESKRILEGKLDRPVRYFAYPFGGEAHLRSEQVPLIYHAGYEGCFSAIHGFVQPKQVPEVMPRVAMPDFRSLLHFELYLSGCLDWVYALKRIAGDETTSRHLKGVKHSA